MVLSARRTFLAERLRASAPGAPSPATRVPPSDWQVKPLSDQIAVVTGAGSGIGKAIALALGEAGASLILVGRRQALLEEVAATLASEGGKAFSFPTDLVDRDAIQRLAAAVAQRFDRLDILVHCAGLMRLGDIAEAPADDFELLFRTNVLAPFLLTQAMLPLIRIRLGQVVFMNSSAGLSAGTHRGPYAATKHALKAIADSLRAEVNVDGIRVLSVYPGRTATPLQERLYAQERKPYCPECLLQPRDVATVVTNALCLPRTAEVTDLYVRTATKPD